MIRAEYIELNQEAGRLIAVFPPNTNLIKLQSVADLMVETSGIRSQPYRMRMSNGIIRPILRADLRHGANARVATLQLKQHTNPTLPHTLISFHLLLRICPTCMFIDVALQAVFVNGLELPAQDFSDIFTRKASSVQASYFIHHTRAAVHGILQDMKIHVQHLGIRTQPYIAHCPTAH